MVRFDDLFLNLYIAYICDTQVKENLFGICGNYKKCLMLFSYSGQIVFENSIFIFTRIPGSVTAYEPNFCWFTTCCECIFI